MMDLASLMVLQAQGDVQCGAALIVSGSGLFFCLLEFGHDGRHVAVRDDEPLPFDWP